MRHFEWLKNLSHIRFGRMGKGFDHTAFDRVLRSIEAATGKTFSEVERQSIARGVDDSDLENSGLEKAMINANHKIRDGWKRDHSIPILRTATFIIAVDKIAISYMELGIFP